MPDPVAPHPEPGAWKDELQAWYQARRDQRDPPSDDTPAPRPRLGILCNLSESLAYAQPETLRMRLPPGMTVAAVLRQAAYLRWPPGFSEAEVQQRSDQALNQVGLTAMHDLPLLQLPASQREQLGRAVQLLTGKLHFSPLTSETMTLTVWNLGNGPAMACHVEVYEGPGGFTLPLAAYQQRGSAVITLMSNEWREVTLPWARQQANGRVVALCYDPLLDPLDFQVVVSGSRHLWSLHYP